MAKLTLTDLSSLTNETSVINAINANNAAIETAMELTLSRNGQSPNSMSANIDMNSFRILNIGAPVDDNDLVRLIDVVDGIKGDQGDQGDPGGPLADGDYGDIVASGGGTVLSLDSVLKNQITDATADIAALGDSSLLDVGTTAGTVAAGNDSRFFKYTVTTADTSYSIPLAALTTPTILYHTSGVPHAYTIDPIATTAYPDGTQVTINVRPTANSVTLTRGAGVSLYANGSTTSSDVVIAAGGLCTLIHIAIDTWVVSGSGLS